MAGNGEGLAGARRTPPVLAVRNVSPEPTAFDGAAANYDAAFTATLLGRMLRERVWELLAQLVRPGERVLELACGTGEDALWLAQKGANVVATDGAPAMVAAAAAKVQRDGFGHRVELYRSSLQDMSAGAATFGAARPFDGLLSNFGGLNTLPAWRPLAAALASQIRPGGWAVLVVMGPICPWEISWYLLHGQPGVALRRWQGAAQAQVGTTTIPVWYPSPRRLQRAFAPWFRRRAVYSLGLWLPPSYLAHLPARWPAIFGWLARFERRTARWTAGWGDHYILVLQRDTR